MPIRAGFLGEKGHVLNEAGQATARMIRKLEQKHLDLDALVNQIRNDALTRIRATASISVRKDSGSVDVGTEPRLNFVAGSGIAQTVTDVPADFEVKITTAVNAGFGLEFAANALVVDDDAAHVWTVEQRFNGGIDMGTSGRFDSNVADAAAASSFLFRPTVAQTSGTDRYIFRVDDSSSNARVVCKADGTWEFGGTAGSGGYINVSATLSASFGINFLPTCSGAGTTFNGVTNAVVAGYFSGRRSNAATARALIGGAFDTAYNNPGAVTETDSWGGWFRAFVSATDATSTYVCTAAGGWKTWGIANLKNFGTITNWYGGYVSNSKDSAMASGQAITNAYGLYLEEQTRGGTINNEVFLVGAGGIWFRDQDIHIESNADGYLDSYADIDIRDNVKGLAGSCVSNAFKKTADTTVANTVTETSLVGTGTGTVTLPANFLIIGRTIRVHAAGYYSDAAAPGTINFRVRLGGISGTVILNTTALTPAGTVSNQLWEMDAYFTCRTTGATGTIYAQGHVTLHDTTAASRVYEMVNTATSTIDTTAAQAVTPSLQWGTADAANTLTCTNLTVEWL